ncbi:uncharacterized protein [Diadema setosum]|uniref:uncharacterized protein n=1 Tax=Diadema setosum TaxID=31175 RepID=UPI003B3A3FE8
MVVEEQTEQLVEQATMEKETDDRGKIKMAELHLHHEQELASGLPTSRRSWPTPNITLEEHEVLVSFDVVSLFTNTPIDQSIQIVRDRLQKDSELHKRTNLTVDDIIKLLEFILSTTYFSFDGKIYRQKYGTAMGSPVSPIVANIYMEYLEEEAIASAHDDIKPRVWKRYVDDILAIVKADTVDRLKAHLDQVDDPGSIKFTHELKVDNSISFLDTKITKRPDGTTKMVVYRKNVWVIRTLMDRAHSIVTEEADLKTEEDYI